MASWQTYLTEHRAEYRNDLIELLRIPSISTQPEHAGDVRKAALWTVNRLHRAGISDARVMETNGHPVVFAQSIESSDKPTVLIYGHFDVQPPEPLELWHHEPFSPTIEDGRIYARGASDMKGDLLLPIIAAEALLATAKHTGLNLKFLFEGEEEIGSPSLGDFIRGHRELLACNAVISADGGIGTKLHPKIGLSYRGLVGVEVRVQTANIDLHSGNGGYAPNALHALVRVLDSLRDEQGRILVDGFYDDVDPIDGATRKIIAQMAPGYDAMAKRTGILGSFGEPEFTPAERAVARPSLEINGMWGGYQGAGVKTVIPHEAFAKITCRLVNHQDPAKIRELVKAHIKRNVPEYATATTKDLPGFAFPYELPANHVGVSALTRVIERATGNRVQFERIGGTVPVMGMLQQILGVETVTIGASQNDEQIHAPNEFLRVENFEWLQDVYCEYFEELSGAMAR